MFAGIIGRTALAAAAITLASGVALAQKKYDIGATDTEIKVGNLMPYSGPGSAYGVIGQVQAAYFKMINDKGGINGRKINFISYDDAYSPPKLSSRRASWWRAMKSCSCSIRWARRTTQPYRNT